MVAVKDLDILFGNRCKVYKAGDVVTGTCVVVVSDQPLHVTGLLLKFSGKSLVGFNRGTSGSSDRKRYYISREYYFRTEVSLLQSSPSETILSPGRHEFPFTFHLERDIPSSFEGTYGHVRYGVRATLSTGGSKNMSVKRHYIVYRPLDLNTAVLNADHPVEEQDEKTVGIMCCASGDISARAWVNRRGVVPGEAVPLYAVINNGSNRSVTRSFFTIREISTFHAMGESEVCYKELKPQSPGVIRPSIPPGGSDAWNGEHTIVFPITAPTGLLGCDIIDIQHQLVLNVVPSGLSFRLRIPLDIIIGTEPLTDSGSNERRLRHPQTSQAADPAEESSTHAEMISTQV